MSGGDGERRRRFEALFASYLEDVVSYCRWRADSPSDAQDAVADVFLTAWRRPDAVPEDDAARAWLYATASGRPAGGHAGYLPPRRVRDAPPMNRSFGLAPAIAASVAAVATLVSLRQAVRS